MESRLREKAKKYLAMCSIGILAGIEGGSIAAQIENANNSSSITPECDIKKAHKHELVKTVLNADGSEKENCVVWASDENIQKYLDNDYVITGGVLNYDTRFECDIEGEHQHELVRIEPCCIAHYKDGSVETILNKIVTFKSDEVIKMYLNDGWELTGKIEYTGPVKTLTRK